MKREYPPVEQLRSEFGVNKKIPPRYEMPILKALSHFPELKPYHVEFTLVKSHPSTHSTAPEVLSVFGSRRSRRFVVTLLEQAEPPMEQALFRNLPEEAQVGAIAHELGHVLRLVKGGATHFVKSGLRLSSSGDIRRNERAADIAAIEHGLSFELYTYARFVRSIPGYADLCREIDMNHLHPNEILESMPVSERAHAEKK